MKTKQILLAVVVIFLQGTLQLGHRLYAQEISGSYGNALKADKEETITVQDYCSFLNEVATSDLCYLYEGTREQIARYGEPGSYSYEVIGQAESPMIFMSWNEAACYCEWRNHSVSTSTDPISYLPSSLFPAADKQLKSNLLTFRVVNTGANAYQAVGEEVIATTAVDEVIDGILAAMFFGGMAEGVRRSEAGPIELSERSGRLVTSSEGSDTGGSLLREHLLNKSDPFGVAFTPEKSLNAERQISHTSSGSGGKPSPDDRTSSEESSLPGSVVDSFVREHEGLFHAFEQLRSRSNSSDEDFERRTSLFQPMLPSTPLIARKNDSSLGQPERKSSGTDKSTTSTESNHHPENLTRAESVTTPSTPEKGPSLVAHDEKLPRTGLTVHECASILKDFTDWRDKIGKHEGLQKKVEDLAREVSWKSDAAAKYRLYPDQERVRARDLAIAEHAKAKREHDANVAEIKRLGDSLHQVSERLLPLSIPEKGDEQYPKFTLSAGISLEQAKQAYLQRQHLLVSGNTPKIEDYLLYGSNYDYGILESYLERQAMLNQWALFKNRGYWLNFSDPLKGPHYSFDQEELIHKANQVHTGFIESAVVFMIESVASALVYVNGKSKRENFLKMPVERLVKEVKGHPLDLKINLSKRDLIPLIKEVFVPEEEIKAQVVDFTLPNLEKSREEKRDIKYYLSWAIGEKTNLFTHKATGRIKTGSPSTRKHFLAEQLNKHLFGDWSVGTYNRGCPVVGFRSKEPAEPYVDLFHRQSIKAASLLDQYRIIMLPDEDMSKEVTRLQGLSPEEHEAELFERAGIEDWKLPTTQEELHSYVLREKTKWDQKEEAKQKEEAIKKEEAMKASNDSNDTYHKILQDRWRKQDKEKEEKERIMKGNQQRAMWQAFYTATW